MASEIGKEILDLTSESGIKKLDIIFNFAKAKLQKVEAKIGEFLRSQGFDRLLTQKYDGRLDNNSKTQIENVFNNQVLPLLNDFKRNRNALSKKELIIKLSQLIEQAELQERFSLSQSAGKSMNGLKVERRSEIEAELLRGIDAEFHAKKLDVVSERSFEKGKEIEIRGLLAAISTGSITQAEFERGYFSIVKEAGKFGGLPMQARLLEYFGKVAKPMMSSGVAPLLLMLSKKTRRILPGLPLVIGGGIYASLFYTLRSKDISAGAKATEVGKTVGETILNIAPITGTIMSAKDTYYAIKKGNKSEAIACGVGTLVSGVFDGLTIVMIASGIGIPGAVALSTVKNATIRGIVKVGIKPLSKFVAKEGLEGFATEAASKTGGQIIKEIGKESADFIMKNSKVAWKGLRHNTKKMILGNKQSGELVSRGMVHETLDGMKQIFTFKHARDFLWNKHYMRQYNGNPEALKEKNFKKYKEMEELSKEKNSSIKSGAITESKIAEHNMTSDRDLEDGVDKFNGSESKGKIKEIATKREKIKDVDKDLAMHLKAEAKLATDEQIQGLNDKRQEKRLKFETYINAIEGELTVRGTEDIIFKLDNELKALANDNNEMDHLEGRVKAAEDWFKGTLDMLTNKKQFFPGQRTPEHYANALYKLKRGLELSKKMKADKIERVEKLMEVLERRSYNSETTDHQKIFYSKMEQIIKDDNVDAGIKKMIIEHLTPQHINESFVKNDLLSKLIPEILNSNSLTLKEKVDFLSFLKTEKNINKIGNGKSLKGFAQHELDRIIRRMVNFKSGGTEADIIAFKDNFTEYNNLIKSFDYDLKIQLGDISDVAVKNFGKMPIPTKVTIIGFLSKYEMLNFHLEKADSKFSGEVLDLMLNSMNDKTAARSIRGAINMCEYLKGTRFEDIGALYKKTLLNKRIEGESEHERLWKLSDLKINEGDFIDPRSLALRHKNDSIANEEAFVKNPDSINKNTALLEEVTTKVLKGDTYSILGYLYEISKEPRTPFTIDAHNKIIAEYFNQINNGSRAKEVVKFTKELCIFIKDQKDLKIDLPYGQMQKSVIDYLKKNESVSKDEKVALCKILEMMPLGEKEYMELGALEKTLLFKKILDKKTLRDVLGDLLAKPENEDPISMMYKIVGLNFIHTNKANYSRKMRDLIEKRLGKNSYTIKERVDALNNKKSELINSLFSIKDKKNTEGSIIDPRLKLDLEITDNGEFFLIQTGGGNRIDLDVSSKLNANYDYVELALSKSPLLNSGNKENTLTISKILEESRNSDLLERLGGTGSHIDLSNISSIMNNSKNIDEVPSGFIVKYLTEFEKPGEAELGERFVMQIVAIQKYLNNKGASVGSSNQYDEVIKYITDLMGRKDPGLLDHQLSLIVNLGVHSSVQKKAYKEFLNNRIGKAEELESLLTHPLFKRIQDKAGVDFKYSNQNIADKILEVINSDKIGDKEFNRLFILSELIKNKSVFYVETLGKKDTLNTLKEAFFKLADNKDPMSQSMLEKLLEIQELIKDKKVLKYIETRLDEAPVGSREATTLMNRFIDGIYKHYKASSEIGFNVHDKAVFNKIQEAISKHLLSVNIRGGKMAGEEFLKRLDVKTKELLIKNDIEVIGIENGKAIYRDIKTGERLENLESIQLLRTEKIISGIEKHLIVAVRSAMSDSLEGKGGEDLKNDILKRLSPELLVQLRKMNIDITPDAKLIKIAEFQNKLAKAPDSEKANIFKNYKEILGGYGVEIQIVNNGGKRVFQFIKRDSEGEIIDLTKLVELVDTSTGKKIEPTSFAENISTIDKIFTKFQAGMGSLRGIIGGSKSLNNENVAEKLVLGHNSKEYAKHELSDFLSQTGKLGKDIACRNSKKLTTLATLSITFGLMKPVKAQAMEQTVLDEALIAAQDALKVNPDYLKAIQENNIELKTKIEEETIRKMTILKTQSLFNEMQMQVDRKIDEIVDKSLAKTSDKLISPEQKSRVKELFKEELYKYMVNNEAAKVESPYDTARTSNLGANILISDAFKGKKGFENELADILNNINLRIENQINSTGIIDLRQELFKQFNSL